MTWIELIDKHSQGIGSLVGLVLFVLLMAVFAWSERK